MAKKKPYRFVLYLIVRLTAGILYLLPRTVALSMAKGLGWLGYKVVTRQSSRALVHLHAAYGKEKSGAEIEKIASQIFGNLAMTAVELLQFPKLTPEKVEKLVDAGDAFKVYDRLLAEGKGLISVTAHIGNWELLAGVFGLKGYKGIVLAREIYYKPYNRWIVSLRQSIKVPTVYRNDATREVLKRLAANEIVGLLPDQDIDSLNGVFVDFFGRPAYTPVAPVRLALSSGAPLLPNFLIRTEGFRYKLVLGEPIHAGVETTRDEAVKKYTAEWMQQFERVIRQYPEQWAWMHNRWKTRPEDLKNKRKEILSA